MNKVIRIPQCLLLVLFLLMRGAAAAQSADKSDKQACTSDKSYCVSIVEKKLAKAPQTEDWQLVVENHGKAVARYPTFGYLLDVYWSPDQKYVAVNNRRANGGDYLWIISLPEGKALKMPNDLAEDLDKKQLGSAAGDDAAPIEREVTAKYAQCTAESINHEWLTARGWKSLTELEVLHRITCFHLNAAINVAKVYEVGSNGVKLASQTISEENEKTGD